MLRPERHPSRPFRVPCLVVPTLLSSLAADGEDRASGGGSVVIDAGDDAVERLPRV
jgi:hypothetical protein